MATSAWLATRLDREMLAKVIHPDTQVHLPARTGIDVAAELAGRPLLRYVTSLGTHEDRTGIETFVCPTPYGPRDAAGYLALPRPEKPRAFVILIDPAKVAVIQGPRWCALGSGIEYILPNGYTHDAVLSPGWAVHVR